MVEETRTADHLCAQAHRAVCEHGNRDRDRQATRQTVQGEPLDRHPSLRRCVVGDECDVCREHDDRPGGPHLDGERRVGDPCAARD
jgi:hypothetical protein